MKNVDDMELESLNEHGVIPFLIILIHGHANIDSI
jgi:hypothetical protein